MDIGKSRAQRIKEALAQMLNDAREKPLESVVRLDVSIHNQNGEAKPPVPSNKKVVFISTEMKNGKR